MNFYRQMVEFGARFGGAEFLGCCVAAVTFTGDGSDVAGWDLAPFADGEHLLGEDVLRFLSGFQCVILQHWSRGVYRRLKEAGVKTVLLWAAIEAIEGGDWIGRDQGQKDLREMLTGFRILGTDGGWVNVYGGTGKIAWAVDMMAEGLVDRVVGLLQKVGFADGFFLDSVMRYSYFGSAWNKPSTQDRLGVWRAMVKGIRSDIGGILWGNTVGPVSEAERLGLDIDFCEHFFYGRESVVEAVGGLYSGMAVWTGRSSWGVADGRWGYFSHGIGMRGLNRVWVCCGWTGQKRFDVRGVWR